MTTPPWCREKVMVYYYYISWSKREISNENNDIRVDEQPAQMHSTITLNSRFVRMEYHQERRV